MDRTLAEALESPKKFDELVYKDPAGIARQLRPLHSDSQLLMNRYALAALLSGDKAEVRRLIEIPEGQLAPGAGYRLLLPTLLGIPSNPEFRKTEIYAESNAPLEVEEACYGAMGLGISCAEAKEYFLAYGHLQAAQGLAVMLGMRNRIQVLEIERQRTAMFVGRSITRPLQHLLGEQMPERRRTWTIRTLAEDHMAAGRYSEALRIIGAPDADQPTAGLRDFLHALLGLPPVAAAPSQVYRRLAQALRGSDSLQDLTPDFGAVLGEPEAGYALLVEASLMLSHPSTLPQVVRLIGRREFLTADQRLMRSLLLVFVAAAGVDIPSSSLSDAHLSFCDRLLLCCHPEQTGDGAISMRHHSPELYILLSLSPVAARLHLPGVSEIPLIAGRHLLYKGATYPLPGRTGTTLILEGMELPFRDLSREELRRLRTAFRVAPKQRVNLGTIALKCLNLSQASRALGQLEEANRWMVSYEKTLSMLSEDAREAIGRLTSVQ